MPVATTATPCQGVPCVNKTHDHFESVDPDVTITASTPMQPMECHDCGVPTHYDSGDDAYHHDSPSAPVCFLIQTVTPHSLATHEAEMPACADPDCEFHHPEVSA